MIGMVLAAGAGKRLGADTADLPKTLLPVDGDRTILDVALGNFASVGLQEAVIVTGFASERIDDRLAELSERHGLQLATVFNPKALEWNNAYSLWCARQHFSRGVVLANGDTVHPASVEEILLDAQGTADLLIALDQEKDLGEEEMKVHVNAEGLLDRIHKSLDPVSSQGEYIGVTLIEPHAAEPLAAALQATFERDPQLYYEDGFQELADRGGRVEHPPILHIAGIPDHILYTWIAMAILVVVSFVATRRVQLVPTGSQNFMEIVLEQFLKELDETIGHGGRRYLPLIGTLGLFILVSNLMGLVPGLVAPTANLNTTAACALIVFVTYHVIGVRKQGFIPYLKHFAGPVPTVLKPLMFVIEIISHCARPLSLSLRLFGNMMAGHILLAIFFFMMGFDGMLGWALRGSMAGLVIGAPAALIMVVFVVGFLFPLKILVAFIQTFIFCKLAMLYIAAAVEEAEHH